MPRSRKNERIFSHISGPRTANPRPGARAGSGALSQGTFVIWRDEKVKNFALFVQIRVLSTRSVSSSKWDFCANSGRSHGGENPKESRKYAKKEVVWSGTWVIFSSENFDFRVLSEWKRLQFHDQEASTRGVHGVAYELLSRNPKSGYFVYNFDTKSVKLGFKTWLKNPLTFPISGHSARTLRSPP